MAAGLIVVLLMPVSLWAVRLKEIASIQGVRDNPLIGYGLVVGLMGTGDQNNTKFTVQSLGNLLQKMGVRVDPNDVKVKNVAAVMVTVRLPAFARGGQTLDGLISSMGDAKSLQGGNLLLTPLRAADGQVYAVAQGPVTVGGFIFGGASGGRVQQNHPTVGTVTNGVLVEREMAPPLEGKSSFRFILHREDFTTARHAAQAMTAKLGSGTVQLLDARTLELYIPPGYAGREADFLAMAETVDLYPDASGKIIVDERTGTVIMGEQVRIAPVAIAHGGLTVIVRESPQVSQPAPYAPRPPAAGAGPTTGAATGADLAPGGQTVVVPRSEVTVDEKGEGVALLRGGATIGELVRAVNAIGMSPRQLITILQAIHRAGALHAVLEVM
jgi:flagellar P-ring protein precursor FlgI